MNLFNPKILKNLDISCYTDDNKSASPDKATNRSFIGSMQDYGLDNGGAVRMRNEKL
jgi:hypothetical protein